MKLAFCFLSYEDVTHREVWEEFFRDVPSSNYAIWVHRKDGVGTSEMPGAACIATQPTEYGGFSLVHVQQRLLEAACGDADVGKCMLVSGDTVPLQPFETVARSVMSHSQGVLAWDDGLAVSHAQRERTVRRGAWPERWSWVWRVAPQWSVLTREHVQLLARHWRMLAEVFGPSLAPDEHVYPVFFQALGLLRQFVRQPYMCVDWQRPTANGRCDLPHRDLPRTFHERDLRPEAVRALRERGYVMLRKVCEDYACPPLWIDRPDRQPDRGPVILTPDQLGKVDRSSGTLLATASGGGGWVLRVQEGANGPPPRNGKR